MAKQLTKFNAVKQLLVLQLSSDTEAAHGEADDILLRLIGDAEVTEAYDAIDK